MLEKPLLNGLSLMVLVNIRVLQAIMNLERKSDQSGRQYQGRMQNLSLENQLCQLNKSKSVQIKSIGTIFLVWSMRQSIFYLYQNKKVFEVDYKRAKVLVSVFTGCCRFRNHGHKIGHFEEVKCSHSTLFRKKFPFLIALVQSVYYELLYGVDLWIFMLL